MAGDLWLADSNILIRWVQPQDRQFALIRSAVQRVEDSRDIPCYVSQNLGEFWSAMTRPIERNGYGMSPAQAEHHARTIESRFRLLPDSPAIHVEWRRLIVDYAVSGMQVHDARLVAAMRVHGVGKILTFNARDFARYDRIEAIHPSQLN